MRRAKQNIWSNGKTGAASEFLSIHLTSADYEGSKFVYRLALFFENVKANKRTQHEHVDS